MTDWNDSSMLQTLGRAVPSVIVRSHASGTWGVAQCDQANGYSRSGTTHGGVTLSSSTFVCLGQTSLPSPVNWYRKQTVYTSRN